MPNKAVFNLKSFSFGKSASMASLLLPTVELKQDTRPYDVVSELKLLSNLTDEDSSGDVRLAVLNFVGKLNPSVFDEYEIYIAGYSTLYKKFRYCEWVSGLIQKCALEIDGLRDLISTSEISVRNAVSKILSPFSTVYPYSHEDTDGDFFYSTVDSFIVDFSVIFRLDFSRNGNLELNDISEMETVCRGLSNAFERGGKYKVPTGFEYDDAEYPDYYSVSKFQSDLVGEYESKLPSFFHLIRSLTSLEELYGSNVNDSLVEEKKSELVDNFEALRMVYNRTLMEEYKSSAVEFPYFLDLGFDQITQLDLSNDTDGSQMHCLERELEDGDNWTGNYVVGDRFRIRDMFRVDKLNKKSAFESAALFPGLAGSDLDAKMEIEDVITRLAQDDWDVEGVIGTATTPDGMYLLTDSGDSISGVVRGTNFDEEEDVQETGAVTSFYTIPAISDYLTTHIVDSSVNYQRVFGHSDEHYSSSSAFDNWYNKYGEAITVHKPSSYSEVSVLRVLGKSSYDFTPSADGIFQVKSIYSDINSRKDISVRSPGGGVVFLGSIGDENYKQNGIRRLNIEIPCNENSQYSYLSFEFGMVMDSKMKSSVFGSEYYIEFSLDGGVPVRYYFVSGKIDNLSEDNPMYLSLKDVEVPGIGSISKVMIKLENDLVNSIPRVFNVGMSSNVPALTSLSAEDTIEAYKNTYLFISNIQIDITNSTNSDMTYGNYLEYIAKSGGDVSDFWNLSRSVHSVPYQHLLEVPAVISLNNTKKLLANYKTADLFSDTITLKNQMDSEYRMKLEPVPDNFILDRFRKYTGIDSCSGVLSLYYDSDFALKSEMTRNHGPREDVAQGYDAVETHLSSHPHSTKLRYKRIETVRSINRLIQSIRHKSNLYSVIIENSNIRESLDEAEFKKKSAETKEELEEADRNLEEVKKNVEKVKNVITMMTKNICEEFAPAHNQLFKVYFE